MEVEPVVSFSSPVQVIVDGGSILWGRRACVSTDVSPYPGTVVAKPPLYLLGQPARGKGVMALIMHHRRRQPHFDMNGNRPNHIHTSTNEPAKACHIWCAYSRLILQDAQRCTCRHQWGKAKGAGAMHGHPFLLHARRRGDLQARSAHIGRHRRASAEGWRDSTLLGHNHAEGWDQNVHVSSAFNNKTKMRGEHCKLLHLILGVVTLLRRTPLRFNQVPLLLAWPKVQQFQKGFAPQRSKV
jgi:hypothetical protein